MFSTKLRAGLFSLLLVGLTMAPIVENFRDDPCDSFPLSYYPMFSKPRANTQRLTCIVGKDRNGKKRFIHYKYAGAGGMNQVRKQLRKMVRKGRADELCDRVAKRLARKRRRNVKSIEIVNADFHLSNFYERTIVPVKLTVQASAKVRRD